MLLSIDLWFQFPGLLEFLWSGVIIATFECYIFISCSEVTVLIMEIIILLIYMFLIDGCCGISNEGKVYHIRVRNDLIIQSFKKISQYSFSFVECVCSFYFAVLFRIFPLNFLRFHKTKNILPFTSYVMISFKITQNSVLMFEWVVEWCISILTWFS